MNHLKRQLLAIIVSFGLLLFASSAIAKPLNVVATTGMIADLAINVGQDKVKVVSLMGSGVDPHLYKATQGDLRRLLKADIIFYNGLHLEGKMQDIFEKLARKKPVRAITSTLEHNRIMEADGAHDPHVWFDVSIWHHAVKEVLEELIKRDPSNQSFYQKNAGVYLAKLDELHVWAGEQIKRIPKSQRMLITAHDAFGYFGRAYGLEVRGLQGVSTASEFGLNDIKRLKRVIVKRKIKAVFVESSVPKKFLQSLVAGVKAEGAELEIGGELFSDAMGLKGTAEGTYIGMVTHNVNTIVSALK